MTDSKYINIGLEPLLELDGEIFPMDNGYWTKIEAKMVKPNQKIPHGIRYSLTLHDKNNMRVIGYDNAHGVKPKKKRFGAKKKNGTTNMKEIISSFMNLRVLGSY